MAMEKQPKRHLYGDWLVYALVRNHWAPPSTWLLYPWNIWVYQSHSKPIIAGDNRTETPILGGSSGDQFSSFSMFFRCATLDDALGPMAIWMPELRGTHWEVLEHGPLTSTNPTPKWLSHSPTSCWLFCNIFSSQIASCYTITVWRLTWKTLRLPLQSGRKIG